MTLALDLIKKHYKNKQSSCGVPYINHIEQGLDIIKTYSIDTNKELASDAFCIHPIVQSKVDFNKALYNVSLNFLDHSIIMLSTKYGCIANLYLSNNTLNSVTKKHILKELDHSSILKLMLIADKIQNKINFEINYSDKHNAAELEIYFNNWFQLLGVTNEEYTTYKSRFTNPLWSSTVIDYK